MRRELFCHLNKSSSFPPSDTVCITQIPEISQFDRKANKPTPRLPKDKPTTASLTTLYDTN